MLPTSSAVEQHRTDLTASDGHSALDTKLAADGIALIEGVHDQARLLDLARSLGTITPHRDSTADGVTTIANLEKVGHQSGFAGFSTDALNPHTDRSAVPKPPTLLLMACRQPAATGGECIAIDGQAVYTDLAETEPEALRTPSKPRSALFGGAAGHLGAVFELLMGSSWSGFVSTNSPSSPLKSRDGCPHSAARSTATPSRSTSTRDTVTS